MTAVVPSPTQPPADASDRPRPRRQRIALGVMVAVAAGSSLFLLADPQSGAGWVHWGASVMTLAAACAALAVGQLSWEHTVGTARAAGLVARPAGTQS
ncbi:MAG: hypothetical protein QOC69_1906 [Mycobacterium sp.]|jgi:hypothetical protein|nr:hypothetical protein [Mycobacterium sp.]